MTVYVDELVDYGGMVQGEARRYGTLWCHLLADSEGELHAFAARIGMKRRWFQNHGTPHYDLVPSRRARAIGEGAVEATTKDILRFKRAARRVAPCPRCLTGSMIAGSCTACGLQEAEPVREDITQEVYTDRAQGHRRKSPSTHGVKL